MLDASNIPDVDAQELLSRFILSSKHFSRDQSRVKPDAFMPPPNRELSVTRQNMIAEPDLWAVGQHIAEQRGRTLYGRGDALASTFRSLQLEVIPDPLVGNPNHANVTGWPEVKAECKLLAMELAAIVKLVLAPA